MITHEIDLNVGQPNNKQFIHINQGEYDSVQIMAHIWNKNKPYTIDADKIRIEGKLSSGALLFDGDSAIQIVKENDTTVSFILTKPIAASVGSFNFSLLFYKGSDVLKKTFPFTIRVSGNPANNVKSDAVLDGVIKKLEQQEQEYNQLATVAKTGDYNDLINKPSGLTVTTNLFKPTFSALISGTKYKILLNSDNTMDVRNNGADFTMIKIGEANVKKGITYKVICYAPDYENLNNTVLSIGGTNVGAQDYYEYIPKADGIIDISIGVTSGNVGTYTIYPMVTPNLAATIDDYVPYTGLYNEINWDVSDLSRGIFQYPMITLHDGNKQGIITYDGTKKSMTLEYFTSGDGGSAGGTANFICNNLSGTEGVFRKDVKIPIYQMDDEGVETLIDTISLKSLYKSCNNLSVNNNTVTIEQFGQQTDSFTLNQNTDITISLIHDNTKLDVAGGEVSGDLYVTGTLGLGNASEYTYIDYNDNEVSFNKVNNSSGKVLGVCGDYFKTENVSVGDDVMLKEYGEMNDEGERPLKRTISLSDLCNRIEKIEVALENLGYMDSNIVSQAISMALDENN